MFHVQLAVILVVTPTIKLGSLAAETTYRTENFYSYGESCNGVANVIRATEDASCTRATCFTDPSNNTVRTECQLDLKETFRRSIGEDYIVQAVYKDRDCDDFSYAIRYRVSDFCMTGYFESDTLRRLFYYTTTLEDDGSAKLEFFSSCPPSYYLILGRDVTGDFGTKRIAARKECVADFTTNVFPGYHKWYTSENEDSGLSGEIIACIVCACVVLILVTGALVIVCRENKRSAALADTSVDIIVTSLNATVDDSQIVHYEQVDQGNGAEQFAAIVEDLFSNQ